MNKGKLWIRLAGLLLGLVFTGIVVAQVSTNYDLSWHLLSGGGGSRSSTNYRVDDSLGQMVGQTSASTNYEVVPGFWAASLAAACTVPLTGVTIDAPTSGYTDTAYSFVGIITPISATAPVIYTWSPAPSGGQGTSGATYVWPTAGLKTVTLNARNCGASFTDTHDISISGTQTVPGDSYEVDDTCEQATAILTSGTVQHHTFHDAADTDWIKFTAEANKTYVIQTSNVGTDHDAVLYMYNACNAPDLGSDHNSFGNTVHIEWRTSTAGTYYLKLQQYDADIFGPNTGYDISVQLDTTAPSRPKSPRSAAADQALVVQWKRPPETDVAGYRLCWSTTSGMCNGIEDIEGAGNTYYQLGYPTLGFSLTNGTPYYLKVLAEDLSGNLSTWTSEISNIPAPPPDTTQPSLAVSQPTATGVYTTSLISMTVSGSAQDLGGNLSRVKVRNVTKGTESWDYGLSGSSDTFYVGDVSLNAGNNTIQVTAYDDANNASTTTNFTINRLGQTTSGAVIIVAGHNASYGLQSNIYNAANRAYRIFQGAGYSDDNIQYLSPTSQAPYGDGVNKVDGAATAANIQSAITTWAASGGRVGPNKPLHIYLMDHGMIEGFCADGCAESEQAPSNSLNTWLNTLESATGANVVNVIMEACHSGSFIDREVDVAKSISKANRVVIASTGRTNNAYASAQGAYFSDAFFSCIVSSGSLKTCYDQGVTAVGLTGVNQTPWLDDNGDGVSNASDGTVAQNRYIATSFGSFGPQIQSASVVVAGGNGTLTAQVEQGAEAIDVVWAAIYAPSFQEPVSTTLNLGAPVVLLTPDPVIDGRYTASYPNGFTEEGTYRVVFYAQDQAGTHAPPKLVTTQKKVYLPLALKGYSH